jgi:hypothetical protein
VNIRERMATIDANLDDVQAGADACLRAANSLNADTVQFDGLLKAPVLRAVTQHLKDLLISARDQRIALQELRQSMARLRQELKMPKRRAIRPPLANADAEAS